MSADELPCGSTLPTVGDEFERGMISSSRQCGVVIELGVWTLEEESSETRRYASTK